MSEASFLAALQLADSALPVGRYVHSYGLEALYRAEPGLSEAELCEVVATHVAESVGTLDGVAVVLAHAALTGPVTALVALDRRVTTHKTVPGSRISSTACGRRLAALATELVSDPSMLAYADLVARHEADGNLAVVEGALAAAMGIAPREALLIELRAAAAAMFSCAVRLGQLAATRAQVLVHALEDELVVAARAVLADPLAPFTSSAFELDVHALRQPRLSARLFST